MQAKRYLGSASARTLHAMLAAGQRDVSSLHGAASRRPTATIQVRAMKSNGESNRVRVGT